MQEPNCRTLVNNIENINTNLRLPQLTCGRQSTQRIQIRFKFTTNRNQRTCILGISNLAQCFIIIQTDCCPIIHIRFIDATATDRIRQYSGVYLTAIIKDIITGNCHFFQTNKINIPRHITTNRNIHPITTWHGIELQITCHDVTTNIHITGVNQ